MGKNLKDIKCNLSRTFNTWCCDTKDKVVTLHVDDSGIDSCWRKFFSLFFWSFCFCFLCFVLFCFFFYNILLIITYNLFILLPHRSFVGCCGKRISSTCSTLQYCYCTLWEFWDMFCSTGRNKKSSLSGLKLENEKPEVTEHSLSVCMGWA